MPRPRKDQIDKINVKLSDVQGRDVLERMKFKGIEQVSDYIRQLITSDLREFHREQYAAGLQDPDYQAWLAQRNQPLGLAAEDQATYRSNPGAAAGGLAPATKTPRGPKSNPHVSNHSQRDEDMPA
jgi:hypothetical protein